MLAARAPFSASHPRAEHPVPLVHVQLLLDRRHCIARIVTAATTPSRIHMAIPMLHAFACGHPLAGGCGAVVSGSCWQSARGRCNTHHRAYAPGAVASGRAPHTSEPTGDLVACVAAAQPCSPPAHQPTSPPSASQCPALLWSPRPHQLAPKYVQRSHERRRRRRLVGVPRRYTRFSSPGACGTSLRLVAPRCASLRLAARCASLLTRAASRCKRAGRSSWSS